MEAFSGFHVACTHIVIFRSISFPLLPSLPDLYLQDAQSDLMEDEVTSALAGLRPPGNRANDGESVEMVLNEKAKREQREMHGGSRPPLLAFAFCFGGGRVKEDRKRQKGTNIWPEKKKEKLYGVETGSVWGLRAGCWRDR